MDDPTYDKGWTRHIEGACAECAYAKWVNRYWPMEGWETRKEGDVDGTEVRCSDEKHHCLIIKPGDPVDRPYVLLIGVAPVFEFRGWIPGEEGKIEKYWRDPKGNMPAFFVPQSALFDFPPDFLK